jgi:hypothetical protein
MADWVTISALATAAGTFALAGATFVAVRSSQESARVTERALLASIRPLLVTPRLGDPPQKVGFQDDRWFKLDPGRGAAEIGDDAIYLAFGVRNVGSGLAVLDRWRAYPRFEGAINDAPDVGGFGRLTRDLYVAPADVGFWQGAFRDPSDAEFVEIRDAIQRREHFMVDVLYGDHEGGQRTISRFVLRPTEDGQWFTTIARHWNLDRPDPR